MKALSSQPVNPLFPTQEIQQGPLSLPTSTPNHLPAGRLSFWNIASIVLAIAGVVVPLIGGSNYLAASVLTVPLILRAIVLTIQACNLDLDVSDSNDTLHTIHQEIDAHK